MPDARESDLVLSPRMGWKRISGNYRGGHGGLTPKMRQSQKKRVKKKKEKKKGKKKRKQTLAGRNHAHRASHGTPGAYRDRPVTMKKKKVKKKKVFAAGRQIRMRARGCTLVRARTKAPEESGQPNRQGYSPNYGVFWYKRAKYLACNTRHRLVSG